MLIGFSNAVKEEKYVAFKVAYYLNYKRKLLIKSLVN